MMQCVAVCCSVLQWIAVCCRSHMNISIYLLSDAFCVNNSSSHPYATYHTRYTYTYCHVRSTRTLKLSHPYAHMIHNIHILTAICVPHAPLNPLPHVRRYPQVLSPLLLVQTSLHSLSPHSLVSLLRLLATVSLFLARLHTHTYTHTYGHTHIRTHAYNRTLALSNNTFMHAHTHAHRTRAKQK